MIKLRWPNLWLTLGYLGIVFLMIVCLIPLEQAGPDIPHSDKWLHLLCYASLAFYFTQLKPIHSPKIYFPLILFLSPLIEILQGQTAYRSFEWMDMLANLIGTLLGIILGYYFPAILLKVEGTFKH